MRFRNFRPISRSGLLSLGDVETVVSGLRGGGLAVLPTETGYMLAADATRREAVVKAFAVKRRDHANPMHVACASLGMASRFCELDPAATALLGRFTPGPLTVIVPKRDSLPDDLVTLRGTVGIRVPDCPATLQVIAALGCPLTATSLNRSGEEHLPVTPAGLAALEWGEESIVDVVRADEVLSSERASTLVAVAGGEPRVLRPGPISEDEVRTALDTLRDW